MHNLDRIQMENFEFESEANQEFEFESESETVLSESEVNELATELMEVTNEAEMEYFLGKLIRQAGRAVGSFVKSDAGKALGGFLKNAARQALPIAGTALGGMVGGPIGAKIGGSLGSFASKQFEYEAEYEAEFETAKSFVRMAADATKSAAAAPNNGNVRTVIGNAVSAAARRHLPQLVAGGRPGGISPRGSHQGTWIRRGTRIILLGV
jgi:uncharacterized protein (DUF697 family)